jgi:putative membrane-bound dehydrogenase-like protein
MNSSSFHRPSVRRLIAILGAGALGLAGLRGVQAAESEPAADKVKFAGLSPEAAAREASTPAGFSVKLFAGEPDVKQPIAFALDDRGRVWVAEGYTYPRRAPEGQGKDRILIFEDTDGDHRFDKRTVFMEGLNLISGLEVGFGGVWVGAAPQLLFIPDRNHDDKPDGPPEVVLDGWAYQDTHETLNTFTWGPDGWLYGCHGVFTHSKVGKPGAPDSERVRLNAGVFRYHPQKKKFELFAEGSSNPWGVDFDPYGQCHIEACVIPHFFHMIQGGRFTRQAGEHFNPYTYGDIETIADHVHYAGSKGPHAGNGRSDAAGGGHAHAGLLVYQGGAWPAEYQGRVFMNNIHGARINMDILERQGSGYVAHHGPDFVNFNDTWSQVLNLISDQDGAVYAIDWYDANQCHHNRDDGHDRSNGRIFKIVYGNPKVTHVDLLSKSDDELVQLQLHPNDFLVRHARRVLQERGPNPSVTAALLRYLDPEGKGQAPAAPAGMLPASEETRQLRLLWTLHVVGGLTEETGLKLLQSRQEYVRAWTLQLLLEDRKASDALLQQMAAMAANDASPVVRLYLASALLRIEPSRRIDVVSGLLSHADDAKDHNLPLMYWYAAEPVVGLGTEQGIRLLKESRVPRVREFISRRMASMASGVASNR